MQCSLIALGIYPVIANPRSNITFAKSKGRWNYIHGTQIRDNDSHLGIDIDSSSNDSELFSIFGESKVSIVPSEEGGDTIVKGSLTFSGLQQPWKFGSYELRYHYHDKHSVLCISEPFEIIPDSTIKTDMDESFISATLQKYIYTIIGVPGSTLLTAEEDIFDHFVSNAATMDSSTYNLICFFLKLESYEKKKKMIAQIIADMIKDVYYVDFTWSVIENCRTVDLLSKKVFYLLSYFNL